MANVIPEEMRREVRSRIRARFILVTSVVALGAAGLSLLILLPSYVALTADAASITSASASHLPAEVSRDTALIANAKALLSELSPLFASSTAPTDAITEALSLRPAGITVDEITFTAGNPSSLMLVGSASNNSAISAYQSALGNDPLFSSVSVPVGALVGSDGGRFSITLSGDF